MRRDALVLRSFARAVFVLGAALSVADGLSTWYVLSRRGVGREANPLVASVIGHLGVGPAMALRSLVGIGVFWLAARRLVDHRVPAHARWSRWRRWRSTHSAAVAYPAAMVATALVVGNNLRAVASL